MSYPAQQCPACISTALPASAPPQVPLGQSSHQSQKRSRVQYMDKTFVKNFNKVPAYQRGMEIWTEEIVRDPDVGLYLQQLFLGQARF